VVQTDATGKSTFQRGNSDADSSRAPSPLRNTQADGYDKPPKRSSFGFSLFCCASNEAVVENNRRNYRDGKESSGTASTSASSTGRTTPVKTQRGNGSHKSTPPPGSGSYGRAIKNDRPLTPLQRQVPSILGQMRPQHEGKLCLVLDLDETLVHSSFQPVKADFIIPVTIEGTLHNVFVIKRPGVDEFLERASKLFEVVIYTASLSKYADPLLDKLDKNSVISSRLFREHCVFHQGHYVKDLSLLNRDVNRTIIVDNSTMSYIFHPGLFIFQIVHIDLFYCFTILMSPRIFDVVLIEHAIDCLSFIDDPRDTDLWKIMDFLEYYQDVEDVRPYCMRWRQWVAEHPSSIPKNYQHLEPALTYK